MIFLKRHNVKVISLIFILISCFGNNLFSQVAIGSLEKPEAGALLQLKSISNATGTSPNADKGLLLPRVNLTDKNELYPMFWEPSTNGPTQEYQTNKDQLDKEHTGLIVYNMNEDYEKELCLGLNNWDGEKWNCLINPQYSYDMICGSVKVRGVYRKGTALDSSNKIELTIMAESKSVGQTYYIRTETIDGISFSGQGKITSDATSTTGQTIVLQGKGTPTNFNTKKFTLVANNISKQTCSISVDIVMPTQKILTIGLGTTYGYNLANSNKPSGRMLIDPRNYGALEESVIKYGGWDIVDGGNSPSLATLKEQLLGANPVDFVVTGYSWSPSADEATVLAEYVQRKGVLLLFCEGSIGNQTFNRVIFNNNTIVDAETKGTGDGRTYTLANIDDPILNGPFGDIRGEKWGDDATHVRYLLNIPEDQAIIYSNATNANNNTGEVAGSVTAYRHKTYNIVWVGEGGFNSQSEDAIALPSSTICPFMVDSNNKPIPKTTYGPAGTKIYNSTFTANVLAWAIYQAQFNGINPPKD